MSVILVTPLSQVESTIRRYKPSHMVTLPLPSHRIETPRGIEANHYLKLGRNDVAAAELPLSVDEL